ACRRILMRCGSNRLPPTHPPVHPPLLACLWEISVPASAETAERRNGQVSFVFWHCAVGCDREFESAFLQERVCEPSFRPVRLVRHPPLRLEHDPSAPCPRRNSTPPMPYRLLTLAEARR